MPNRVSQQCGVWPKTSLSHPCLVAAFGLEEKDEQSEVGIYAQTSVEGFQLGFVEGELELMDFDVGLDLNGASDLFEHHCTAAAPLGGFLLPFEDFLIARRAEDVEKEFWLAVGEPRRGEI